MNDKDRKNLWYVIIAVNVIVVIIVGFIVYGAIKKSNNTCEVIGMDTDCKYSFYKEMCYCKNHNFNLTSEDVIQYNIDKSTISDVTNSIIWENQTFK